MQWFIDGAYGDLYRTAMRYPDLHPPMERNPSGSLNPGSRRLTIVFHSLVARIVSWCSDRSAEPRVSLLAEEGNHAKSQHPSAF